MGKSRFDEHKAFLSWLLNVIKDEEVYILLVSGDIFDTGTPPNYALELYYNFLKELSHISSLKSTIAQMVFNALNQLQSSGKVIGVISHVESLKERIPLQIKV
jgi:DNA repair exonuclease SbcCD nuclease subunit